jgi:hypothetical protein
VWGQVFQRPSYLALARLARCSRRFAIPAASTQVEIRRRGPDGDRTNVHVQPAVDPNDVAQETPILVNAIGCGFRQQAHTRARREQALGRLRRLPTVTLRAEIDLGRVDLNEPDTLTVAKRDRVPIDDVVESVDGWS